MDINQKFKIFLAEKKLTLKMFSEMVDKNSTYISSVMNGRIFPGRKLIEKIEEITGKKIKYADFVRSENLRNKKSDCDHDEEKE